MKRKILAMGAALILGGIARADMTVSQWMSVLAETDAAWREGYEAYVQECLAARSRSDSWLPSITAKPGYSLSRDGSGGDAALSQSASLGLVLSQKLPTGGTVSASFSQSLSLDVPMEDSFGYQSSGSVSLSQPLFYAQAGADRNLKRSWLAGDCGRLAGESRWRATQLRRTANTLSQFLNTAVLIERQKSRKALIDWYATALENDRLLFEAGQLSGMEYAEARNDSANVEAAYVESAMALVGFLDQAKAWGLSPASVDIEAWLASIEADLASSAPRPATDWELDALRYDMGTSLDEAIDTEMAGLPALSLSYSCTPGVSNGGKTDAWAAVTDYWGGKLPFGGSFSATVSIPLTPWDAAWKNSPTGESKRRSFRAQCADIDRRLASNAESRSRLTEQHDLAASQTKRTWLLEKDRLALYRIRAGGGDVSELDVRYQEIQAENALLDWYAARIARVSSRLTGD